MSTQNWIVVAVVLVLVIIAAYFGMRPAGEAPTGTTPPATTDQPGQPAPAN